MAMARLVSQALSHNNISGLSLTPRTLAHHRHRSGKAHRAQFLEVDLESSLSASPSSTSASSSEDADVDTIHGGIKKLEEVIQSMIVRRAAPDWLPFRPGASYWVPPPIHSHPYGGVVEVIGRLSAATRAHADGRSPPSPRSSSSGILVDDEMVYLSSHRGWPSSSYFSEGGGEPSHPIPADMEVEVEVKIVENSGTVSSDYDEEG